MELIIHHICILLSFPECEQEPFWSLGLILLPSSYPLLYEFTNFHKSGKKNSSGLQQFSLLRQWLDFQSCWQRFYSETAPPCRLYSGSPVCCVGALPSGHSTAGSEGTRGGRGIYTLQLHYLAAISAPYAFDLIKILSEPKDYRGFTCMGCKKGAFRNLACYLSLQNSLKWVV